MITLVARDAASEAAKAAYKASVELWTLYSFGVAVTLLRTYARVRAVGFRNLKADDYLIWVAIVRKSLIICGCFILTITFLGFLYHTDGLGIQRRQCRPWSCK